GNDLAAGLVTGSNSGSPNETNQSTGLTFTAGSDNITGMAFSNNFAGISVGGAAGGSTFTWEINGSGVLIGHLGATLAGAIAIELALSGATTAAAGATASPTITATLTNAFPHAAGSGDITISGINVVATDTDGDTVNGAVTVTVQDDVPSSILPDTASLLNVAGNTLS